MPKTRVLFCIPNMVIGGVEFVFVRTLTELLKDNDLEISVIFSSPLTEPVFVDWFNNHPQIQTHIAFPLCQWFESFKDKCRCFPLKQIRKLIFSIYKNFKRIQLAHSDFIKKQDVIIDYANFGFVKEIRHIHKPKITWVHGSINYFNNNKFYDKTKYYDKIVVLSESIKQDLSQQYPDIADKLVHIYNPINLSEIMTKSAHAAVPSGCYFACVSRLDYDKDIETLLYAFEKFWLSENKPNVKLYIIGGGTKENEFKACSATLKSGKHIVFTGKQSNPFGYMRGAMAHILSSYNEGLPTVLIETAAVGTLNISSNCKSGPAEILMHGRAGVLFEPGNAEELACIMSDVYAGRIDADKLIRNGTTGLSRFTPDSIIPQITKLIREVK